jgi:hypothetical protein
LTIEDENTYSVQVELGNAYFECEYFTQAKDATGRPKIKATDYMLFQLALLTRLRGTDPAIEEFHLPAPVSEAVSQWNRNWEQGGLDACGSTEMDDRAWHGVVGKTIEPASFGRYLVVIQYFCGEHGSGSVGQWRQTRQKY